MNEASLVAERRVLEEYERRQKRNKRHDHLFAATPGEIQKAQELRGLWFDKQREFFDDPHRRKVGFCTRRAGKTIGFSIFLLVTLLEKPTTLNLYLAQTSKMARMYMWPELTRLIKRYDLPYKTLENNLWITHKRSEGRIVLAGVDNTSEIEKFRGPKWQVVGLDEAASFGAHIENLILEVVGPALRDNQGTLIMLGTAGRLKKGLFYEACHGLRRKKLPDGSDGDPVYKVFKWSLQDNPFLSPESKDEQSICDDEGLSLNDPRFLREYRGEWVTGENERIFSGFCERRNVWNGVLPGEHRWQYLFGCDFGWEDESAITVVAFSRTCPVIYLCETWSQKHSYADDVAAQITRLWGTYGKCQVVGDVGGYGKAIQVQLLRDYGIHVQAAKKTDKLNYIEFQNSAFLRGDLMIKYSEKRIIEQLNTVAWNEARTDAGPHEKDDLCFVAGTKITTEQGLVDIEDIRPGMRVLTRYGYRDVLASGPMGESETVTCEFDDGKSFTCTPGHKIWANDGWIPAKDLRVGACYHMLGECQNESNGTVSGGYRMRQPAIFDGLLLKRTEKHALSNCSIEPSGKNTAGRSPMVTTSITKTTTAKTTASPILSASHLRSIASAIHASSSQWSKHKPPKHEQNAAPQWPLRNGLNTCLNALKRIGRVLKLSPMALVLYAASLFSRRCASPVDLDFAVPSVAASGEEIPASMMSHDSASSVARPTESTDIENQKVVLCPVTRRLVTQKFAKEKQTVYNLMVDEHHEYLACDILSRNCFSLTYAWRYARFAGAGKEVLTARDSMDRKQREALEIKRKLMGAQSGEKQVWWQNFERGRLGAGNESGGGMWGSIVRGNS